jgi:hypothetical protein
MAADQLKKIGLYIGGIGLVLTVLGSVVGMAWTGSGALTSHSLTIKNNEEASRIAIEAVADNQSEDRASVKELAGIVSLIREEHAKDYKELKEEDNESKIRYERTATQYATILSHMQQQTESGKHTEKTISDFKSEMGSSIGSLKVDMGKMQTKVESLFKDND